MRIPKSTALCLLIARTVSYAQELSQDTISTDELPALCSVLCLPLKLVFPNCDTLCQTCEKPKMFCKTRETAECVDTSTDVNNCGKCGNKCGEKESCCTSKCVPENNFQADVNNCGKCGVRCDEGQVCCDSKCTSTIQLQSDGKNCGKCGTKCGKGTTCCNSECLPNDTFQSDPVNCSKCGNKCPETFNCHSGHCLEPHTCKAGVSLLESCQDPIVSGSGCGAGEDELCDCMESVEGDPFCGAFDGQFCQDMCNSDNDCQNSKGKKCARRDKTCCSAVATDDKSHKTFKGVCFEACAGK
ncbi:hypothetical protein BDP67DRAFT_572022 [Colletotrichum lupini]|nr:hypothetical protein BDP67DRAFT_572022 [Colletotrichum lupini]